MEKRAYYITGIFTILQLAILCIFGYTPYPDSIGYSILAKECVETGYVYPIPFHDYSFIWNIGAINAVVCSLKFFGSTVPLMCLYALFKGLTALLFYLFAKRLAGPQVAITALLVYVLYPANYGECTSILSELPFIFLTFLAIHLTTNRAAPFAGGIIFAIANTFRPMAIVFLAAYVIWFLFIRRNARRNIIRLLAGYCITIVSIGTFNYIRSGQFIYQAGTGWMALMQYSWDNDSDKQEDYVLFNHADPMHIDAGRHYNCIQKDSLWRSHFLVWLNSNKAEYISQMPKKLADTYVSDNVNLCTFMPDKAEREYMYEPLSMKSLYKSFPHYSAIQWLTIANLVYYYAIIMLFILSIIDIARRRKIKDHIFSLAVILLGTAIILLAGHGEARFHQPLMPFFIIIAAHFIHSNIKQSYNSPIK